MKCYLADFHAGCLAGVSIAAAVLVWSGLTWSAFILGSAFCQRSAFDWAFLELDWVSEVFLGVDGVINDSMRMGPVKKKSSMVSFHLPLRNDYDDYAKNK